MMSSLF